MGCSRRNAILRQCNKLLVDSGNNPFFPKKTWGERDLFLNPEILQLLGKRRRKDRLSTAGKCSGFYAVTLHTFHMQTEVYVLDQTVSFSHKKELKME